MFMPFCLHQPDCVCTWYAQLLHLLHQFPWIHALHSSFSTVDTVLELKTSSPEEYAEPDTGSRSYYSLAWNYWTLHHVNCCVLFPVPAEPACWYLSNAIYLLPIVKERRHFVSDLYVLLLSWTTASVHKTSYFYPLAHIHWSVSNWMYRTSSDYSRPPLQVDNL